MKIAGLAARCDRLIQEIQLVTGSRVAEIRAELATLSLSLSGGCRLAWYRAEYPVIGDAWSVEPRPPAGHRWYYRRAP